MVILMSFADVSFTKTEADFDALFNEPGYAVDGAQEASMITSERFPYGQLFVSLRRIRAFTEPRILWLIMARTVMAVRT